jgi:hypothetical protein
MRGGRGGGEVEGEGEGGAGGGGGDGIHGGAAASNSPRMCYRKGTSLHFCLPARY